MVTLQKYSKTNHSARKFLDYSTLDVDREIHKSFTNKKKLFFRPDGNLKQVPEELYLKLYGDKLYHITLFRKTVVLEKDDNKVSIRVYNYDKERRQGVSYFIKKQNVMYFTYNKKRKILYVGNVTNRKKIRDTIAVNPWNPYTIQDFFNKLKINIGDIINGDEDREIIFFDICQQFFEEVYGQPIKITNEQGKFIPRELLLVKFFNDRNIKHPNNFLSFYKQHPLPNLKDLKKGGNSLLGYVQKQYKLEGKKYNRLLHQVERFNPTTVEFLRNFVTEKEIKNLDDNVLINILNAEQWISIDEKILTLFLNVLTIKEKRNVFNVFISFCNEINGYYAHTLIDHIKFYLTLKVRYKEDITWNSKTRQEFTEEHVDYSNRVSIYKNGIWDRTYSEDFINEIEKELISPQGGIYYPIVFTKQNEYYDESNIQSNCVKTYVKNTNCFIVSLRLGGPSSKERATIEYRLNPQDGKIFAKRKQTLGRFNKPLNESWMMPIEELDNQVEKAVKKFKLDDYTFTKTTKDVIEYIKVDMVDNLFKMCLQVEENTYTDNYQLIENFLDNDF